MQRIYRGYSVQELEEKRRQLVEDLEAFRNSVRVGEVSVQRERGRHLESLIAAIDYELYLIDPDQYPLNQPIKRTCPVYGRAS